MNCLLWYNGIDNAKSVWSDDMDAISVLASALKAKGYSVVWTVHSTDSVRPMEGYEQALADWQKLV